MKKVHPGAIGRHYILVVLRIGENGQLTVARLPVGVGQIKVSDTDSYKG